jgi:hypothetical protein
MHRFCSTRTTHLQNKTNLKKQRVCYLLWFIQAIKHEENFE